MFSYYLERQPPTLGLPRVGNIEAYEVSTFFAVSPTHPLKASPNCAGVAVANHSSAGTSSTRLQHVVGEIQLLLMRRQSQGIEVFPCADLSTRRIHIR